MKRCFRFLLYFSLGLTIGSLLLIAATVAAYHLAYKNRVYPGVHINQINFGNREKKEIEKVFQKQNIVFEKTNFHFLLQDKEKIITGRDFSWNYAPHTIAQKAFSVGRQGNFFADLKTKFNAFFQEVYLSAEYQFNQEKLKELLQELEKEIYLPAENALFQFENGKVLAFREEKEGRGVDIASAIEELKIKLKENKEEQRLEPKNLYLNLKIIKIKPEVTLANANQLGIRELLAEGVSWFSNSPQARIDNIILASSRLNGIVLKPEEVFSFNQSLGDVSQESGYEETWIIKEGKTVLGDGGGVCQVSTTVFRAALNSGLPIIERQAHAYRVHYYEEKSPLGLDATVYDPSPDLKFLNNTPAHLLIQSKVDEKNKKLTFQFYGTADGRKTVLSKPLIWDQVPPPEPLYQDDPELPADTIKQVDWEAAGAKVKFDYQVIRSGEVIYNKSFTSIYRPWRAVYLRGTGGQ